MAAERLRACLPYALYALLAAWYCAPLFEVPDGLGGHDWDQHLFYYASVLKSVVEYGQPPFWNPWYCGGNVLWQNPQVPLLSPVFPMATVMSLPLAMKVNIVLHYWVGLAGMHVLLTRALGLRAPVVAAGLSVVAACSGAMAMHLAVGHSVFLPVLYLPLQLHFTVRAVREGSWRAAVIASAPLALMVYNGALHAVPMSVAAVGSFALWSAVVARRVRPLLFGAGIVVLGLALSAPKLLPVTLFVTGERFVDARTTITHPDAMGIEMLQRAYLDRYQDRGLKFEGQRSGWFEYGNYIGGLAAAVFVASLGWLLVARKEPDRWLGIGLGATAVLFLVLSAGEFAWWAPASLARHVPLFSSFRIPSRYTFGAVLFAAATAGWVGGRLLAAAPMTGRVGVFVSIVAVVGAADIALQTRTQFREAFSGAPLTERFRWGSGVDRLEVDAESNPYRAGSPMLHALMADRSFFRCYESLQLQRTASPDRPLISVDGDATVREAHFTPNRIEVALVSGRGPSILHMNQNMAPGWTSALGPVAPAPGRGTALAVPPGTAGRYALAFIPPGLFAGLGLLVVALAAAAVAWRRDRSDAGATPVGQVRSTGNPSPLT